MNTWNLTVLHYFQNLRTPAIERFFLEISDYGTGVWILSIVALMFWLAGPVRTYRLAFTLAIGDLLTGLVKNLCCIPRPWILDPTLLPSPAAQYGAFGFSFPSGHTTNAALLAFGLADAFSSRILWILATVWSLLMATSRMVLGVHTPTDVLAALFLALLLVLVARRLWPVLLQTPIRRGLAATALVLLALATWFGLHARPIPEGAFAFGQDAYRSAFSIIGLLIAAFVERRRIRFDPARLPPAYRLMGAIFGLIGLILMLGNLRRLLAPFFGSEIASYLLAAANSLWICTLCPLLLKPFQSANNTAKT